MTAIDFRTFRPTNEQIASIRRAQRVTLPAAAWRKVLHFGANGPDDGGPITLAERIDFALRDHPDSDEPVTVTLLYSGERRRVEDCLMQDGAASAGEG